MSFHFSPEQVAFLSSDHAAEILAEYRRQAKKYADSLRIQTALRGLFPDLPISLITAAMETGRLRSKAASAGGFPADVLATAEALEMASSESTARLHASLLPHDGVLLDVAAGIGSDAIRLAGAAAGVVCIEADPVHARILQWNLDCARMRNTLVLEGRAEYWLPLLRLDRIRGVYADPARRDSGGRHRSVEDMHPPLHLFDKLPNDMPVLVKIAPGVTPPSGWNVATVAAGRECPEQLLHRNCGLPPVCAVHADTGDRWIPSETDPVRVRIPRFLIEPHAAIIRTGQVAEYLHEYGAEVLDPQIAYGWTESEPLASIWHQAFRLLRVETFNRKALRRIARELDFGPSTEIKKRGFPDTPEQIRAQLKLHGSRHGVIIITRRDDGHLMLFGLRLSTDGNSGSPHP